MNYTEDFDFCKPYIMDGERVLWTGRPEKGLVFDGRELFLIPFSIFWLAFSIFWEVLAFRSGGSAFFMLWGLPFVAIGLYMLFGRIIHSAYLRKRTFYVITDKKLIVKRGGRMDIYNGCDLPPRSVKLHKNGNCSIIFSEEGYSRRGRRTITYISLENRSDAAGVQNALNVLTLADRD